MCLFAVARTKTDSRNIKPSGGGYPIGAKIPFKETGVPVKHDFKRLDAGFGKYVFRVDLPRWKDVSYRFFPNHRTELCPAAWVPLRLSEVFIIP